MFKMLFFKSIVVLTSYFTTAFLSLALAQHLGLQYRNFYKLENRSLVGNVTDTKKVKDYFECPFLCLERGPSACLSFNVGKTTNNGYYTCELSNSDRYLDPHRMQQRASYDYYGVTTESLFSLLPCTSSPCKYGGTCIHGPRLGEFSCQCGVEITVLPFIDDKCNVETNDLVIETSNQGVFHAAIGRYRLNFNDARRLCEILGATQATYNQLKAAWEAGLQRCALGWLADGTARFPMRTASPGCGNYIGIVGSSTPINKNTKYNAWCYKE
ncbi:Hyaluronan and proteoglycan link protein 3 [Desmophyllum pertusum]|uniref:Hyaluronan and proteoglycan link protein 3 n=1 Tax=Desmophyllum pertusum TaxID=174260 RepID=A0A9W9Z1A8_9CNID|nr:Hyaluronan and proteoglycan link protein 3 [Desmophyllum pertusum]